MAHRPRRDLAPAPPQAPEARARRRAWRCLVTGGAGFIGSHLVDALLAGGCEVAVLDDLSSGSLENLDGARAGRLQVVHGSAADAATVEDLVLWSDEVYHLAARVGVRQAVEQPALTLLANMRAGETVLAACARRGRRVILASSSEIYGMRREPVALREDDARVYGPTTSTRWAYAAGKAVDETLALAWHAERGLPVVVARLFNVVGPRQSARRGMVVPRFVEAALAGAPLEVHGDGRQTRCFLDVRDCVRALLMLARTPAACGGVFNVGSPEAVTIQALAGLVRSRCGSASPIVNVPYAAAFGAGFEDTAHRRPDLSRIEAAVGWHPQVALADALDGVVAHARVGRPALAAAPVAAGGAAR